MLTETQRYVKECESKKVFKSQAKALRFQREARSRSLFSGQRLVAYECTWCRQWHLGHPNPNGPKWTTGAVAS